MKTVILYATKHGASKEIARRLAERLGGAELVDLRQNPAPELAGYDCAVLGGSVYAGALRKDAKSFAENNAAALKGKKMGLFISGASAGSGMKTLEENFPPELVSAAKAKAFLGGAFDPAKAGPFDRLIMWLVTKGQSKFDSINDEKIAEFAKQLQE